MFAQRKPTAAMAQGRSRGVFVARTKVRDAWFCPPPPDDREWFVQHPTRRFRRRPLHPDDRPYIYEPRCNCTDHAWYVIVGKLGRHLLPIRVPANDKFPADDEAKLCDIFTHFVRRDPRLLFVVNALLKEEEQCRTE
jgi:hypothetical protein